MASNKLILITAIIVILIISASLLYIFERSPTSKHITVNTSSNFENISTTQYVNNTNTAMPENYSLAVENFENILEQAREIYLNAIRNNESQFIAIDNFSKMLILNSTIVNETTLWISNTNTDYTYILLQVYNANNNFTFCPQRIEINNISVELIPKNPSVTYTGGTIFNYVMSYDDNSYNVTFYFIGFMFSQFYLTASTQNIAQIYLTATTQNAANDPITYTATIPTGVINIYAVTIAVNNELGSPEHISYVYLILIENV